MRIQTEIKLQTQLCQTQGKSPISPISQESPGRTGYCLLYYILPVGIRLYRDPTRLGPRHDCSSRKDPAPSVCTLRCIKAKMLACSAPSSPVIRPSPPLPPALSLSLSLHLSFIIYNPAVTPPRVRGPRLLRSTISAYILHTLSITHDEERVACRSCCCGSRPR